jgi:hypothetical protein
MSILDARRRRAVGPLAAGLPRRGPWPVVSDDMEAVLEAAGGGGRGRPLADVPSGRALGGTLLHCAASPGVVNFLLDEGVPLDGCDAGGNTALHTAAEEGRVGALVHLLISLPDTVHNGRGQLALHAADAAGQTRAVAALLSKGLGLPQAGRPQLGHGRSFSPPAVPADAPHVR